jgi:hypothetical protein
MPRTANHGLTKLFQEAIAIEIIEHDILTPATTGHDMIDRVRVPGA